ncbi:MAG TPA: A/G-specific adenine glycosylase [bacterium]|nr:A/G-specific adenine glycosylase [bacterium]
MQIHSTFRTNFRRKLLQWYRKHKRDLPWRRKRDPYAIWVSEIMLQQTQVVTVIPYYEKFLTCFPTLRALAEAPEEAVLAQWAGLGYYRRAKLLHRGAQAVLKQHGGRMPQNAGGLRELPGIGPYTAGAIASIAFGQAEPLVDGNVVRVLSRIFRRRGHAKEGRLQKEIWELAAELIDPKDPGDFNQGLMELGATVCRVVLPSCHRCPVAGLCAAAQSGDPESFPETPPAQKTLRLTRGVAVALRGQAVLLLKPKVSRWFQGMWALPQEYVGEGDEGAGLLRASLKAKLGLEFEPRESLPATVHGITHHRITTLAWRGAVAGRLRLSPDYEDARFFPLEELKALALPSLDRKVLKAAQSASEAA